MLLLVFEIATAVTTQTNQIPAPVTTKRIPAWPITNRTPGAAMIKRTKRTFAVTPTKPTPRRNQKEFDRMFDLMSRGFDLRTQSVFVLDPKGKNGKQQIFALEASKNVYNDPLTKIKYALPSLVQDGPSINHTGSNIGKTNVYPYDNMRDLEPLLSDQVVASRPFRFAAEFKHTVHYPFVFYEVRVCKYNNILSKKAHTP